MWSVYLIHWNNWILLACFYVHQFHPVQLDLVSSLVSKWSVEESHLLFKNVQFMSVQLFSHVRLFATPWIAACHHQLLEFTQTHVQVSDAIQPSHPLLSPSPPAFNLSQHQGLFQGVSSLHQVAKGLELQHRPFQSGLISFRIAWFDLFAVQGTLKSLLQHHNSKASIPWPTWGWWKVD